MKHKHIAEEVHFSLKELFEICSDVIYTKSDFYEENGIEQLYDIDDVEYQIRECVKHSFFVFAMRSAKTSHVVRATEAPAGNPTKGFSASVNCLYY